MRVVLDWVTFWEVWFGEAKSGQYHVIEGGLLQMVLESLPSLRLRKRAQAHEGHQWALIGTSRMR
jgi:hypothetical protein